MTQKNITDQLRARFTKDLAEFLTKKYDCDVCKVATNMLMIPTVDDAGEGRWVKFSIIVPKDSEEENGTDGYSLAREYQLKVNAATERRAKNEAKSKKSKN